MNDQYDIIGDIHGMADALIRLLETLGYQRRDDQSAFSHPEGRKVIFVGDLIDRGAKGFDVVDIAKKMTEAGHAITVMGNHELNAIFYHTQTQDGAYLRPHSPKNKAQHQAFLDQGKNAKNGSAKTAEIIAWFKTLPLYIENEYFRVVHACWDHRSKAKLDRILDQHQCLPEDQYINATTQGHEVYETVETWLKGDEYTLPDGVTFTDKSGHVRRAARLRWWVKNTTNLADLAMLQGDPKSIKLTTEKLKPYHVENRVTYTDQKPVFIGHYWMKGPPALQSDYICCVDYSAGKGDKLCAYRWDGDGPLCAKQFVYVNVS